MQLKTYKKIKRIINEKILGNAIVVTPELVPNQNWDWKNGDKAGDSMAVPSKNFYNYLGHYISPKEALEAPLGADVGPFENDLSIAANRTEVSSPSPLSFGSREPDETDTRVFRYVASTKIRGLQARVNDSPYLGASTATGSDFGGSSSIPAYSGGDFGTNQGILAADVYTTDTILEIYDVESILNLIKPTNSDNTYNKDLHEDFAIIEDYEWQGDWGDPLGEFQTAVEFSLTILANNDRGRSDAGIGIGAWNRRATNDTKSDITVWIGDKEDVLVTYPIPTVAESGYVYNTTYEFSNAYFSTGKLKFANGENSKKTYTFRINRKPNEKFLNVYVKGNIHGNRRGELSPHSLIPAQNVQLFYIHQYVDAVIPGFFNLSQFGPGLPDLRQPIVDFFKRVDDELNSFLQKAVTAIIDTINAGTNLIVQGIFGFIFALFRESYVDTYHSTLEFELRELKVYNSIFDKLDIDKHPATRYFGPTGLKDPKSYVYTQYHYPFFDSNRFMVYGNEFYANLPYMQNEVVVGNSITASKQYKENRYFVPNLFRILYETNIGVFYEFLLRQLNTGTALKYNYNIKTIGTKDVPYTGHFSNNKIEEQVETVYDLMFPTDKIFFPNIANTGFSDLTCYDTSSLSGTGVSPIVDTVITPYNHQFSGISSEYDDVYSKYALGTKIGAGSTGGAVTTRIQEINDIIGDFSTIKTILESSDGYSLENWTTRCNDPAQHVGLEELLDLSSFGLADGIATYSGSASDWNYEKYKFNPASATGIPAYYSDLKNGGQIYEVYYNPAYPTSPAYWSPWINQATGTLSSTNDSDNDLLLFLNDVKNSIPAINTGFLFFLVEDDFVGDGGRSSMLCVAIENFQWDQVDIETKLTNLGYTNTVLVSNVKNSIYDIKKISGGVDNIVTDVGFDVSILPNNYAILTLGGLGGLASVASLRNQDPSRTYVYDNHTDRYSNFGVNATNKFTDAYVIQPMSSVGTTSSSLPLSDVNQIENAYMVIDGIRYEFIAGSWQAQSTGGSASPKNLSYKIIQFILWYMQPNGIADQSRLTTRSLFEYEKLIDQDINNFDTDTYNQVEADPTKSNNPIIIGDTIYERKC